MRRTQKASFFWSAAIVVAISIVPWLLWDLLVFVVVLVQLSDSAPRVDDGWILVAGIVVIPLAILTLTIWATRKGQLVPASPFGRAMFGAQLGGATTLLASVVVPIFALSGYVRPGGKLTVDNRVLYTSMVTVSGHLNEGGCSGSAWINGSSDKDETFVYGGIDCWGDSPSTIEVFNALGMWTCGWTATDRGRALVITDAGPNCPQTAYTPGILRQPPPLTPGPPVSPPGAGLVAMPAP
jgi:hypothetical protein